MGLSQSQRQTQHQGAEPEKVKETVGEKTRRETDAEAVTFSLVAENHRPGPHPQRFGERRRGRGTKR